MVTIDGGGAAFARAVDSARGGSIVMNGSIESVRGRPKLAHYTAAKFGMVGLAQTLAIDFGDRNIRVNVIGPGLVATESTAASPYVYEPSQRAAWGAALPAGRMAVPDDVARVALFYLSYDRYYYLAWLVTFLVCAVWARDEGLDLFRKRFPSATERVARHPLNAWFAQVLDWWASVTGVTPGRI